MASHCFEKHQIGLQRPTSHYNLTTTAIPSEGTAPPWNALAHQPSSISFSWKTLVIFLVRSSLPFLAQDFPKCPGDYSFHCFLVAESISWAKERILGERSCQALYFFHGAHNFILCIIQWTLHISVWTNMYWEDYQFPGKTCILLGMEYFPKTALNAFTHLGSSVWVENEWTKTVGSHQGITHQLPGRATLQVLLIFIFRLLPVSTSRGLKQLFCS